MDTRYVQSFVAVVECGSLAEAARRLNLTAAAIAARLRALEQDLGAQLVQRAGRSVKPTEAGLKILERARAVMREIRDIRAIANDDTPLGELRLGVSSSVLTGLLSPVLHNFYAIHQKLAVFIEPGTSSRLYQNVLEGALDAAIIVEPQFSLSKEHVWRPLAEEPLIVLAPLHMAGRCPHELLASEPFIRYDRSTWGGLLADRYLRKHGLRPQQRLEIDGLMAIATMVLHGLGVSVIPDWAPDRIQQMGLASISLPPPAPIRRMGLLWPSRSPHAQLVQSFYKEARMVLSHRDPSKRAGY
jgi:DNA-binding transcriptional LysR family regulator